MAKSVMVLGTMSNVGKSVVAAGLCRVFAQDGHRVSPFKSQNMALNSYITKDGLEMGRAQVVQAECAYKEPDVRMNPILLKPTSDQGSQVVLNGEVLDTITASSYYEMKPALIPKILSAYQSLSKESDFMVLEGAGSPAEINLMENDIVNAGLAKMVKSPCVLVGDIDRGGVFASIYGTVKLLGHDAGLIKGLIINKFRGDVEILKPGLLKIEALTGIPVLGVIPYERFDIDDEDSLSDRFRYGSGAGVVDIAVMRLPRISNFTDFNVFQGMGGVSLRYVDSVRDFNAPDMVIIPGTKNTIDDLLWLRQNGLEAEILKFAHNGGIVFGVCGGYQMLGGSLVDEAGVESGKKINGIGLLDADTCFTEEKVRTRVQGKFLSLPGLLSCLRGLCFEGYEIHMGVTEARGETQPLSFLTDSVAHTEKNDGLCSGNIYGSYVHGVFDRYEVAYAIVNALCQRKGVDYEVGKIMDREHIKQREYDRLADLLRNSLDMEKIYRIMEEGV